MIGKREGVLAAALVLASCQPLPHPFASDRPPTWLLMVPDSAGVSIGPVSGTPAATAARLGAAVAKALQKHDIPASDRTASLASLELDGRIIEGPPRSGRRALAAFWELRNPAGHVVATHEESVVAQVAEWQRGDEAAIARLATASADALAPLIVGKPPTEAAGGGELRVRIGTVGGAPGDGNHSLANALAAVLKRQKLDIIGRGPADVTVEARVSVTPVKPDKQHVKIIWHVRRADGTEIGTVGQENDVPRGRLNAAWGDVAYSVALAAETGILQLVARAGPPAGGKS